MGKEWYWVGSKSSKRGGGGGGGRADKGSESTPSGCMCSFFQLFDFHQFQFPSNQQHSSSKSDSFLPDDSEFCISKGAEAPKNSLELEEEVHSSPITITQDQTLNIPVSIQIKTNGDTSSKSHGAPNDSSSSEISSSPSTNNPNLVARLMGLDLLPDQIYPPTFSSPNPNGKSHLGRRHLLQNKPSNEFSGTRSLPETPRISSARRSDVEHRLSLQINEQNLSPKQQLVLSRISSLKRKELKTEEENRSPGHYARQIVKHVKESVGRKVALDITNTVVRNREELVSQLKSKKMAKVLTKVAEDSSPGKISMTTCSPRLKFLEPTINRPIISNNNVLFSNDHNISQSHHLKATSVSAPPQNNIMPQKSKAPTKPKLQDPEWQHRHIKKCKKVCEERFGPPPPQARLKKLPQTSEIMIRNKQEEVFVRSSTQDNFPDKKCKKTLNITVSTLLLVKKDPTPPATKILQKTAPNYAQESKRSSQLSSCSSHQSYKQQEVNHTKLNVRGSNNQDRSNGGVATATTTTTTTTTGEYEYITRILRRTGINKDTPVSFTRWFSPSHPLDPSIFYYLEHFATASEKYASAQLTLRCNRKLLFHLVDEMLVEILKPYLNMKPSATSCTYNQLHGSHLIEILCSKVRSFPCADCHVLEDIDALVDKDMPQLKLQSEVAFCEEGEGIVMEIEKDLLDKLIYETAVIFYEAWY